MSNEVKGITVREVLLNHGLLLAVEHEIHTGNQKAMAAALLWDGTTPCGQEMVKAIEAFAVFAAVHKAVVGSCPSVASLVNVLSAQALG